MRYIFNKKPYQNKIRNVAVSFEVDTAINVLKKHKSSWLNESRKIPLNIVDDFLYSGKYNSVLGPQGFNVFKKKLKEITKSLNNNTGSYNLVNLDIMFEVLLDSGVYYLDEYLPESFKNANDDIRWLTAYRYIAKNFPEIDYKSFRTIVKRFQETRGYSFYIEENDSDYLKNILKKKNLFIEVVDLKATLLQLNQSELKNICEQIGVQPSRTLKMTSDRILASSENIEKYLPEKSKTRVNLIIKDKELATGDDLINLDKYLRELAKLIRSDFDEFIKSKTFNTIVERCA